MTSPAPRKSRPPFLVLLAAGALALVGASCVCCIFFASRGKLAEEQRAGVGSAARLVALRDRLDRVVDGFPAQPVAAACSETPPADPVVVLAYSSLTAFRRGEGDRDDADSEFSVTSTYLRGSHRPANDVSDADAYQQLEAFGSPLRPLVDARWVAVMRTTEARRPAVTLNVFTGGHYEGWLVVFDLQTGRALCAQPVRATNGGSVDVGALQAGSDAAMQDLLRNLEAAKTQAGRALHPALRLTF